jgi:acetoin utilization deacetylase AcuC-like enzyme
MGLGDETYVAPRSYEAALLASGAVVTGLETVLRGEVINAFALVRPPGHHAFADHGEGFCLFNNIAIAATTARAEFQIERVLIVDFDVHHGNGATPSSIAIPTCSFLRINGVSIRAQVIGMKWAKALAQASVSTCRSLPGWGDEVMRRIFADLLVPIAAAFTRSSYVSAGYDPGWTKSVGFDAGHDTRFLDLTRTLVQLRRTLRRQARHDVGRGYGLDGLAYGVVASFAAMLGDDSTVDLVGPARHAEKPFDRQYLDQLLALHGLLSVERAARKNTVPGYD